MRVYVNWETQEVVGPNQIETAIDRKISDYLEDDDLFEEYLETRYTFTSIWCMDDKQKENIFEEYTAHLKELAEDWFEGEFCEYDIE